MKVCSRWDYDKDISKFEPSTRKQVCKVSSSAFFIEKKYQKSATTI
jgi:hypothetical protein